MISYRARARLRRSCRRGTCGVGCRANIGDRNNLDEFGLQADQDAAFVAAPQDGDAYDDRARFGIRHRTRLSQVQERRGERARFKKITSGATAGRGFSSLFEVIRLYPIYFVADKTLRRSELVRAVCDRGRSNRAPSRRRLGPGGINFCCVPTCYHQSSLFLNRAVSKSRFARLFRVHPTRN